MADEKTEVKTEDKRKDEEKSEKPETAVRKPVGTTFTRRGHEVKK